MKIAIVIFSLVFFNIFCFADSELSFFKNDEKHIAAKVDVNNVPIDPACKIKTVWQDVRLVSRGGSIIPSTTLKNITVVKFHFAGAWIAWTDENGYHEPYNENFIPWRNFPDEIKKYYEKFYLPDWKIYKSKKAFFMRSAQIDPHMKKHKDKRGTVIQKRSMSGVICRTLYNNVFIPYSELPLDVRTKCGFYENESYIPTMPVLAQKASTLKDNVLFVPYSGVRIVRRFKEGDLVRVTMISGYVSKNYNIFVQKYQGRMTPNHKSDLHLFKKNGSENICTKCKLSDHINDKFLNFMFDRQSRTPCPVKTNEYAFVRKGTQKVGKNTINSYQYLPDFDEKYSSSGKIKKAK